MAKGASPINRHGIPQAIHSVAAANIVEGAARKGRNEFRHFLDIALGSLSELEYALEVALALQYLKPEVHNALEVLLRRARFFTWKLKTSMR